MCNHYRNIPGGLLCLSTWREYIGAELPQLPLDYAVAVHPKRQGLILRMEAGAIRADAMMWGVSCQVPGQRPGSVLTKHGTNVRNLNSPFWRSMLKHPARRCLVPLTSFAEPVIGGGRASNGSISRISLKRRLRASGAPLSTRRRLRRWWANRPRKAGPHLDPTCAQALAGTGGPGMKGGFLSI
jgi:putative SOS response-associated peptidase YedK